MIYFVGRRLLGLVVTLLVTSFAVFGSLYLTPGSPLAFLLGGRSVPPETVAAISRQYHLDDPFFVRYWTWLTGVLRGDFGSSLTYKQTVTSLLSPRVSTTVLLVAYASALILLSGVGLGILSALRPGRTDTLIMLGTTVGLAVPSFVAAVILIALFAVRLRWFPVFGSGNGVSDRLWHLTLPAIALALSSCAYVARITRAAVQEELGREHVQTARSRGLPESIIIRRHVVRNALIPITTVAGLTIASLIGGTVVVETAFTLNGLGSYLVLAVQQKDFPVVQAIVLILVSTFVVINTLVDILYAVIDPRIEVWRR